MDPVHQTQGLMSHGASYRVARYFARRGHRQARHIGQPLTGLRSLLVSRYMLKCSCRETCCVSASFPCLNSPKMFRRCGNGGDLIPKKGNYYNIYIYIYMYVYIYICMYIYMYVCIYIYMVIIRRPQPSFLLVESRSKKGGSSSELGL